MEGMSNPYSATMDGLKMKKKNEGVINIARFAILPTLITTSLIIHILSLECGLITAKYENLTDNIHDLERLTPDKI